jgi:hypothetical protein
MECRHDHRADLRHCHDRLAYLRPPRGPAALLELKVAERRPNARQAHPPVASAADQHGLEPVGRRQRQGWSADVVQVVAPAVDRLAVPCAFGRQEPDQPVDGALYEDGDDCRIVEQPGAHPAIRVGEQADQRAVVPQRLGERREVVPTGTAVVVLPRRDQGACHIKRPCQVGLAQAARSPDLREVRSRRQ